MTNEDKKWVESQALRAEMFAEMDGEILLHDEHCAEAYNMLVHIALADPNTNLTDAYEPD